MKISAATMPTKKAAIISMPLMKRSMRPCPRGLPLPPASRRATSSSLMTCSVMMPLERCSTGRSLRPMRSALAGRGAARFIVVGAGAPAAGRSLEVRLVLDELGLKFLHRRVRIDAGFLHVGGPGLLQRLGGFLPLGHLRR